jgi:hypothetical protein
VKYELKIHIGIYKCIYVDEKKVQPTAWKQITVTHLKLLNTEKTDNADGIQALNRFKLNNTVFLTL